MLVTLIRNSKQARLEINKTILQKVAAFVVDTMMQSPQVMSLVSRIVHELDDSSVDSTEGIIKSPAKRNSELLNSLLGTVTRS